MSFFNSLLTIFSSIFLLHALYSIHEHQTLNAHISLTEPKPSLPLDVKLELLVTTSLLLLALVLSSSPLRPIAWAEWAGRIEREGWDPAAEGREQFFKTSDAAGLTAPAAGAGDGYGGGAGKSRGGSGNPWRGLEERRGFWAVKEARQEFAQWVREGSHQK